METKSPTNSKRKEPRWLKLKVSVANDLDSEEYKIESLRVNSSLTPSAAKLSKDGFEINERGVLMTPPHIRKRSLSFETKRVSSQSCLSIDSCVPSRYEKTATDSLNFETLSIDPIKIQSEEPSDIKLSHFVSFGSRIGKGSTAIVRRCVHVKCESPKVYATKSIQMSEEKKTRQLTNELTTYFRIFSDSNSREVPGILGFYEAFYHDGVAILILEYMNRGTLESMINEYGKIPEKLLCLLAKQILLGLETLHRNNQVHRDIKPENILLNTFGMAKIADFGIVADLYGQSRLYCFEFVGTNKWMSPERILAQPYSFASDIWSFGLVLVKCATGKFAYQSENGILGLIQRITKQDPPKLDESTFSPNLCSFVSKCLQTKPSQRWTASQLLDHEFVCEVDVSVNSLKEASWPWYSSHIDSEKFDTVTEIGRILRENKLINYLLLPENTEKLDGLASSVGMQTSEFEIRLKEIQQNV